MEATYDTRHFRSGMVYLDDTTPPYHLGKFMLTVESGESAAMIDKWRRLHLEHARNRCRNNFHALLHEIPAA